MDTREKELVCTGEKIKDLATELKQRKDADAASNN